MEVKRRHSLFLRKFKYKASWNFPAAGCYLDSEDMLTFLKRIEYRYNNSSDAMVDHMSLNLSLDAVSRFIDWRGKNHLRGAGITIHHYNDKVNIYSNDLSKLRTLIDLALATPDPITFFEADNSIALDILEFKLKPKHKYRTFFKSCVAPANFRTEILDYISRYKNTNNAVVPSKAFTVWLNGKINRYYSWKADWCRANFFVDYSDPHTYLMLKLLFDNMVDKQCELKMINT